MDPSNRRLWPLATEVLGKEDKKSTADPLPATYHYHGADGKRLVGSPAENTWAFLQGELSLGRLPRVLESLWFAGAARPAMPLHSHVAILGREIAVADRMDLHLLWTNRGKLFVKPIPRFLLSPPFCRRELQCPDACVCRDDVEPAGSCRMALRSIALGFLYTYACLISSETDFHIAVETRLLPRKENDEPISWTDWKTLARELLRLQDTRNSNRRLIIHPRFQRAELRLSRINTAHRLLTLPRADPYLRARHNYSGLFRDNLAWIATATIFIVLVLTAMQVGLATDRLRDDAAFQRASYGFTVFSILWPMCAFGLVVLRALFYLFKDLPRLVLGGRRGRRKGKGAGGTNTANDV